MAQQTTAITPQNQKMKTIKDYLEVRKPNLAEVLPKHMTADRMVKVVLTAALKTPALLDCTPESLFMSVMQASELGLEPSGALGHAYLVPFKDQCTLIVGYKGFVELARRSGEIESIEVHPVYERDTFKLRFGLNPALDHEPYLDGDPGKIKLAYGIARLKGGATQVEVMTLAQIEKIRDTQLAKLPDWKREKSPWRTDFDEMARKTVVRRLAKYLPLSPEKAELLAKAFESDGGAAAQTIDVTPSIEMASDKSATRAAAVLDRVQQAAQAAEAAKPEPQPEPNHASAEPARDPEASSSGDSPAAQTQEFANWLIGQMAQAPTDRALAKLSVRKNDCRTEDHERVLDAFRSRQADLKKQ